MLIGCEGVDNLRGGRTGLWVVLATIVSVRVCALWQVKPEEYRAEGFESLEALQEGLRRYYPDIDLGDEVTVVRWESVEGALADQYRRLQELRRRAISGEPSSPPFLP